MEKKLLEEINNIRNIMGLKVINEDYDDLPIINDTYPNIDFHPRTKNDRLNPKILDDIQYAAKKAGIKVTVNWAKTGHDKYTESGAISRHYRGLAVDVSQVQGYGWSSKTDAVDKGIFDDIIEFVKILKEKGYKINSETTSRAVLYFGFKEHGDHVHISNTNVNSNEDSEDNEVDIENIEDDISMDELINLKDYLVKKGKEVGKEKVNKLVDALKKLQSMKVGDIGGKIKDVITTASKSISELE
jgi:hypothetical protein